MIVAGVVFGLVKMHATNTKTAANKTAVTTPSINYNPPTKEEQQVGNDQKQQNVDKQQQIDNPPATPQSANVTVTDATYYPQDGNNVEIRAYINNAYESDGACTATLTRNGKTVTKAGSPFKDVSTTQCGAMDIPRSQFTEAGDWQLIVSYRSATTSGQSTPQTVSIKP